MSRPQETFNKKELEKRRLQKRKEKEQRKEQRKADSKDGKSFEDMLAYVDENGNITSTPPDPTKKKKFNEADVNLESKNKGGAGLGGPEERRTGKVAFFNKNKGYGLIRDAVTQENIFVHINDLEVEIKENDRVTYDVGKSFKGAVALRVRMKE
jgi:cold shock CspA family protein